MVPATSKSKMGAIDTEASQRKEVKKRFVRWGHEAGGVVVGDESNASSFTPNEDHRSSSILHLQIQQQHHFYQSATGGDCEQDERRTKERRREGGGRGER